MRARGKQLQFIKATSPISKDDIMYRGDIVLSYFIDSEVISLNEANKETYFVGQLGALEGSQQLDENENLNEMRTNYPEPLCEAI